MQLEYEEIEGRPDDATRALLFDCWEAAFGQCDRERALTDIEDRSDLLVQVARVGEVVAGFKIAFRRRRFYLESWTGGVHPDYRRRGIARELMRRQHRWAAERGYRLVWTETSNASRPMLLLNISEGFDIIGTYFDRGAHLKIILQKWVGPAGQPEAVTGVSSRPER